MSGITNLDTLLSSMEPQLQEGDYVFCTFANAEIQEKLYLQPLCCFQEKEGLTLILLKNIADKNGITYNSVFNLISLTVHSSLDAVGLTAAISTKLATNGISANVVAAFYHDHIFVPKEKTTLAIKSLLELQQECMMEISTDKIL